MSILDNDLVRKYFGCDAWGGCPDDSGSNENEHIALRIIIAMEEPIGKGERYLDLMGIDWREENHLPTVREKIADSDLDGLHAYTLRLPDRFQKRGQHKHIFICECGANYDQSREIIAEPAQRPWRLF